MRRGIHMMLFAMLAGLLVSTGVATATILTFDSAAGQPRVGQAYGDRVQRAVQGGYRYEMGQGPTPHVTVGYGPGVRVWNTGYGGLVNVIYGQGLLELTLKADVGYRVVLHSFELAGWPNADHRVASVQVLAGGSRALVSRRNVLVKGSDGRHTRVRLAPLRAAVLKIRVDSRLLGSSADNIGLDNVVFGEQRIGASAGP